MQTNVDTSGIVTRSAIVSTDELLVEFNTAQGQATALQAKADALADILTQVATAPNADPAIAAKINAVPALATKVQVQVQQVIAQ